MEFPPEWLILQSEDFEIAAPLDPGRCGMELMAQVRPNGPGGLGRRAAA